MNTDMGYKDVTHKIVDKGYRFIDENRLVNPRPMSFDYDELFWFQQHLYSFVIKNYPEISSETIQLLKSITMEELRSRPYIFTSFFRGLDEDVYLLKIKDGSKLFNVYLIKYETWSDDIKNYRLIKKIRFESEKWYRNFYETEEEYNKNKYSITLENKQSFIAEDEEKVAPFKKKGFWNKLFG